MKNNISTLIKGSTAVWLIFILLACNNNASDKSITKAVSTETKPKKITKPKSSYHDTLAISASAAVFFHPDSLQLLQIKAITDSMVFDGSMHEYFYQMRNARMFIKKSRPGLPIIESEKNQYLMFVSKEGTRTYVDLNTKYDAHGLIIFDGIRAPVQVDMTNVETIMGFYFAKK